MGELETILFPREDLNKNTFFALFSALRQYYEKENPAIGISENAANTYYLMDVLSKKYPEEYLHAQAKYSLIS